MKLICISAQSEILTIQEIVPENKAVARLKKIKGMYLQAKRHNRHIDSKLIVKTGVVNPELPFIRPALEALR